MANVGERVEPGMLAVLGVNTASTNAITIDQVGDAAEFVFQAEADDTITHLGFRYSSKGAGTPPQYTIALKDVSSGNPGTTTLGSNTFTPPNDSSWNNTWQWVALSSSVAVTRGTHYSITISTAGTPNSDIFSLTHAGGLPQMNLPVGILNNNGARARQSSTPVYGYKSATTVYGLPGQVYNNQTFSDSSNPDELGVAFTLVSGSASTFQVVGAMPVIGVSATTGNVIMTLETTGGTVLQQVTIPKININSTTRRYNRLFFDESTLSTLSIGTEYYLWFKSDDTASLNMNSMTCPTSADAAALPGGSQYAFISRNNGGAATKDATQRLMVDLVLADVTASGGGTSVFSVEG